MAALIALVAVAAGAALAITSGATLDAARGDTATFVAFLGLTIALQLLSVNLYGSGGEGVSATGMLAAGFVLGPGPAMVIAIAAAVIQWIRRRGQLHKAVFDASDFALSAGAAAAIYALAASATSSTGLRIIAAAVAGVTFKTLNTGLLCLAMSVAERESPVAVWRERFRWASVHYLAFGPVAFTIAVAYDAIGLLGLAAFAVPPILMVQSVRQYVGHTRESVEELRRANEELRARHDDLQELFEFAGGLAAHAHDRDALVAYAEEHVGRLAGTPAKLSLGVDAGAIALATGSGPVGSVAFPGETSERWRRVCDAVLPQLSTALESAALVERIRKTHLATIAALSRTMEAKDHYTGGHTERVAEFAVAIGQRLGFSGAELDDIEVGALMHDIGKIGIPEAILQKKGPLTDEEWEIMKRHPLISEYILADVDVSPIVRAIVRSSHERIDGTGYPDGLTGDEIPLPARIVLVADALDAMTTERPYRPALQAAASLAEIRAHAGSQFCPTAVAALEQAVREQPSLLGEPLRPVRAA